MTPNSREIGVFPAVWLPLVVAVGLVGLAGCTGTDILTSGSGEAEIRMELDNASGRFVDNPSDRALMVFQQIEFRPVSAQADAALGSSNLALLQTPFRANFVSGVSALSITPQTSGQYRLIRLVINRIQLLDTDDLTVAGLSDPVAPICQDFVKDVDLTLTGEATVFAIEDSDLPAPVLISLDGNNAGQLTMRVDYPNFLAAFNASLDCASCACPGAYMPNQIPRSCSLATSTTCSVDADCPAAQTCVDCSCPIEDVQFEKPVFKSMAASFLSFE